MTPDRLAADATAILADLIAIDTTSRESNLDLIAYVERHLAGFGATGRRVFNDEGTKANLYASIGPAVPGGVVLSGHSDVVPVDGQPWTSDPWRLTRRGDRLFGRGTCDMKGFLALSLAIAPHVAGGRMVRPLHLAISYDEEVGCLGAPSMIAEIARELPSPAAVVVGEPTDMVVVSGHKGIATWTVTVTGHEAHSSLIHLGASANMVAVRLMQDLADLADRLAGEGDPHGPFCPHHATLTIGQMAGGTAVNILARECRFAFDLRTLPGQEPEALLAPFFAACADADAALRARFPEAGVRVERRSRTPSFAPEADGAAERLARRWAGDNGPARAVPYAAEAGQFQGAGFSTVICGPGSIAQAHQPDEYIEVAQMERGAAFMLRLADDLLG
ncbi:acetylornithine deacetylase [Sphingomonas sp. 1185]|uniref:acetylornithine deacetylase n=1 Tax=Sphingomonas sp. 1185 TaxID=3156411 RepID=UPI003390A9D6